jgi:hypothetical protein
LTNSDHSSWQAPPTCSITTSISSPFYILSSFGVCPSCNRSPSNRNLTFAILSWVSSDLHFVSGNRHPSISSTASYFWSWKKLPSHPFLIIIILDFSLSGLAALARGQSSAGYSNIRNIIYNLMMNLELSLLNCH